jgi:6-phosphogluconolactonase (cycloisomerase 2 family)
MRIESMMNQIFPATVTRRNFLTSASVFALAPVAFTAAARAAETATNGRVLGYVGTYNSAADGSAHGEGIYLIEMNPHTGELSQPRLVSKSPNPAWISIHPSKKFLYAANEMTGADASRSAVTAFAIDSATGNLTELNSVSSEGAGPAHMSLDAKGKFVFVANYAGGTIAVLPVNEDGSLGKAVDVHRNTGDIGSKHATSAPRGSFAISGHESPHAHMILPDPSNKFVIATDLAQDRIYVYNFDAASGKLTPAATPFVSVPTGDGPRHFVFHPNGRWFYLLEEEASVLVFFHYDPRTGTLTSQQTISALPPEFAGTNMGSEIAVSPDGKFLYSANRLHDTITICSIAEDGRITRIGEVSTMGDYPRYFCFDPSGQFVHVCDQRSDCITTFVVDRQTGMLKFTGKYTAVGSPSVIAFL